ncbi:MAG TPA: hypothetical protein VHW92_02230, partial [Mycobacteriales bacterium]|nr:hypothetical protein [Mycobacteriales bacterium]
MTAATLVVTAGPSAAAVPAISFAPLHGVVGSTLVITESGFPSGASVDVGIGGGTTAGKVSTTKPTITVKVPVGATKAPVVVTDSADSLVATSSGDFTVDPTPVPPKHTKLAL